MAAHSGAAIDVPPLENHPLPLHASQKLGMCCAKPDTSGTSRQSRPVDAWHGTPLLSPGVTIGCCQLGIVQSEEMPPPPIELPG